MKVWTLMENTTCRDDLACEHGLSLYIEAGGLRILFDAGQSAAFADNAEKMGIDLSAVDLCVLSHGHYDHGGGLTRFLEINDHAPVYVSRHAFGEFHNASGKYIGLDSALLMEDRIVFAGDNRQLSEAVSLHSCPGFPEPCPSYSGDLTVQRLGRSIPDDFRHEQYLLVREGEKRILVSGCSHRGVMNIKTWFAPDVFIGGFHFMNLDPEADRVKLRAAASFLLQKDTVYHTGHCTGEKQYALLKESMGERLQRLSTGSFLDTAASGC
ncbi:MAG: MBL fold metallo-hydrolase [Clostridia bacterium]|nr:MBL fold metallo-hydrolase [Clostridia bacterium]